MNIAKQSTVIVPDVIAENIEDVRRVADAHAAFHDTVYGRAEKSSTMAAALETYDTAINAIPAQFRAVIVAAVAAQDRVVQLEAEIAQLEIDKSGASAALDVVETEVAEKRQEKLTLEREVAETQRSLDGVRENFSAVVEARDRALAETTELQTRFDALKARITAGAPASV